MNGIDLYFPSEGLKNYSVSPDSRFRFDPASMQNQQYQICGLGGMTLENVEQCAIFETLLSVRGNRTQAAKKLRVSLKTIYNKIQRYQLSNYDFSQSRVSQKSQDQLD